MLFAVSQCFQGQSVAFMYAFMRLSCSGRESKSLRVVRLLDMVSDGRTERLKNQERRMGWLLRGKNNEERL